MADFEREQCEILRLSDEVRYDRSIHRWGKHLRYVDIVKTFFERHIPKNFRLAEHSRIEGFPIRFHLVMVKKDAKPKTCEGMQCL